MIDKCNVTFKSKMSKQTNCSCDACHDIDRVVKVTLPKTLYFDGNTLSTKYNEYWLCGGCRTKLVHALDFPEDE